MTHTKAPHHAGPHPHHNAPHAHGATSRGVAKEMGREAAIRTVQDELELLLNRYPADDPYYEMDEDGRPAEDHDGDKILVSGCIILSDQVHC